jgi:hypothetical protein
MNEIVIDAILGPMAWRMDKYRDTRELGVERKREFDRD